MFSPGHVLMNQLLQDFWKSLLKTTIVASDGVCLLPV